jgi:hypothetical protein
MNLLLSVLGLITFWSCTSSDFGKIEELDADKIKNEFCEKEDLDYHKLKDDICVVIPANFPHIAGVGTFASDRGCMSEGYYFGGKFTNLKDATPAALSHYGWSDKDKRHDLAKDWVKYVVLVWESVVSSIPKGFSHHEYFDLHSKTDGDKIIVACWVREPAGMLNQSEYYQLNVVFNEKGELVEIKETNRKVVPG